MGRYQSLAEHLAQQVINKDNRGGSWWGVLYNKMSNTRLEPWGLMTSNLAITCVHLEINSVIWIETRIPMEKIDFSLGIFSGNKATQTRWFVTCKESRGKNKNAKSLDKKMENKTDISLFKLTKKPVQRNQACLVFALWPSGVLSWSIAYDHCKDFIEGS